MDQYIITITKQYASLGGRIGKRVAEKLGIPVYNRESLEQEAAELDASLLPLIQNEEQMNNYYKMAYPLGIGSSIKQNRMFELQRDLILKHAKSERCVIIGRCADYILKEKDPFRIFVYADAESKLKRCRERSPEDENLSDSKIRRNIRSIDKGRARYYNYFSRQKWGARENYDLLINTSGKDVKQVSEAVADHLKRYLFE